MPVLLNEARSPPFAIYLGCTVTGVVFDIDGRQTGNESLSINLSSAPDLSKDVFIHFNPRPQQNTIVLNTMKDGKWGKEKIAHWDNIFNANIHFKLRLTATQDGYEVYERCESEQHRLIATFAHRQDLECNYLVFGGQGFTITFVERH